MREPATSDGREPMDCHDPYGAGSARATNQGGSKARV